METSARPRSAYQNHVLVSVLLVLAGIAVALGQFKVPSIMPAIMEQFDMDVGSASMLMSVFTLAGIFLSLPTGFLARRFGAKNMMVAAVVVMVAGTAAGALATSAEVLVLSRAVEGVALVFCGVSAPLAIRAYVAPGQGGFRERHLGAVVLARLVLRRGAYADRVRCGGLPGNVVRHGGHRARGGRAHAAVRAAGWRGALPRARPAGAGRRASREDGHGGPVRPQRAAGARRFLMFNMVLISFLSFSPTFLQGEGMDATLAGFASTLPMLVAVASSPLFGVLADKTGRLKALMVASMLVMGPCAAVLLTTAGPALWAAALVMGVVGLGAPTMFLIVYPSVVANKDAMPIAMGFLVLTQSLGQFLGSSIMPAVLGAGGWAAAGAFALVLGLVGTALLALVRLEAPAKDAAQRSK
ncbi:MAG: MFS transporter [Gordonibacter pamelaeae]